MYEMALIKCKECGKMISDISKVCPNCGIEIKSNLTEQEANKINMKLNKKDILIIIALSIFSIINFIFNNYSFIAIIYFITYITCYWLTFLYYKNKKILLKILSGITLLLSVIMYLVKVSIFYEGSSFFVKIPSIYVFYELVFIFTPLIILYLIVLAGEKYGTNKM